MKYHPSLFTLERLLATIHTTPQEFVECWGKQKHSNWSLAHSNAETMRKRWGEQLNVYRCRFCGNWHIGGK